MNNYATETEPKAWASGVPVYCAHDAIVDVASLVPNPKNPNTHPDNQIQLLGRIIRETGWRAPITVSTRSGFIVKGHGRQLSALLEELKQVPVDYQHYDSEEQELADLVADNRIAELAEIDQKMLADIFADIDTGEIPLELTGFTEKEVENLITSLSEALHNDLDDPDDVPEVPEPEQVITQRGDLWILGRHRLLCGDSTNREDVDKLMDGAKADMVFTDPPYGYQYQSNKREKTQKFDVLTNDDKILDFMPAMKPHIDGFVFVCTTWKTLDKWLPLFKKYFELTNMIIWDKGGGGIGDLKHTFFTDYEIILCSNNGHELTGNRIGSVWSINKDNPNSYIHPTQKPVSLIEQAINSTTVPDDNVLDLFGGSGSTMIACEQAFRNCYIMELEPKYCDVIVRRYIKTTGKDSGVRLIRKGEEMGREYIQSMFSE